VTKSYGDKVVYENLDFSLRRGERIAFLGPNGRGKSTLMKLIAGLTDYQDGRRKLGENVVLSYFAQFQLEELNPNLTVIDELASVAGDLTTGRLRSILGGFLFQGDDVFKKVSVLSGGEKSRLILAKIMLVGPNLLLLDEPTNHLDIPGRDVLETALRQFPGTICLISHDRRLINAVANKVLVIKDRGVDSFPGNFDDYMRLWKDRLEQPPKAAPSEAEAKPAAKTGETRAEKEARKRKEARARQRAAQQRAPLAQKVRELEQRLDQLAQSLDETAAALADPATYQDAEKSKTLTLKHADLKEAIDAATEKWEQAALQLEELDQAAE
jgi:ATP-binding cassette subfamily F protein 3